MTGHGKLRKQAISVDTPEGERFQANCTCGKTFIGKNAGAAGFSLSAHVKKALGQPVFAAKPKTVAEAVANLEAAGLVDATQKFVLPATLVEVPSDEYEVTKFKTFRGYYEGEGSGFEGTLTHHGKPVAKITYRGDGGRTEVQWLDYVPKPSVGIVGVPFGKNGLDPKYGGSPFESDFLAWAAKFEGNWAEADDEDGFGSALEWSEEGCISVLTDEAEVRRGLDARKNTPILREGENPRKQYGTLNTPDRSATAKWCVEHKQADTRVWVKGRGWTPAKELAA